ncbi:c-type cytochrome [Vibrio sp. SCSIO 43140]|uniref:c-type cytochrome n=1 Tax=Vibrio sp. SCSIO 43140 TaxID=2819100 RepID=UPI002074C615|nr:c-type cytochrome [Vibrio sp. SCSIO 43140]USD60486.1 c-type cytochrome [Vibrio sp. SCSIO 43140]
MNRIAILSLVLCASPAVFADAYLDREPVEPGRVLAEGEQHHQVTHWDTLPEGEMGESVKRGYSLFMNTQQMRASGKVNNGMNCTNCHLGGGSVADAAPMWAAFVSYPAYRSKNKRVNTFQDRLQGCFLYSMNAEGGKPPEVTSQEIFDLNAYSYWLSFGVTVDNNLPGRGFGHIAEPELAPDYERGQQAYQENCAVCHSEDGQGRKVAERYVFPPLWGPDSFNWGAGMHKVNTAAAFIKHNMPLGQGGSLSDQQAWDIALFMDSHERPQDPRYDGDISQTQKSYHGDNSQYGEPSPVDEHLLGTKAY